jgi:hypothetical protein
MLFFPFRAPAALSRLAISLAVLTTLPYASICWGDEKEDQANERRRAELLEQMRSLTERTKVQFNQGEHQLELVTNPVFRYDDQPRRIIDATIWVWTVAGRPVAFQKIEAMHHAVTDAPEWCYCFASVSPELLSVEWPDGPPFQSSEPGISFRPVPDAPAVADGNVQRKRQARELARGFAARILLDPSKKTSDELRLLTTPIFEYTDSETKEFQGAVFGFATNGTNSGLLVLVETRAGKDRPVWHFSPARLTACGVTLTYRDNTMWEAPFWTETSFSNWRFFFSPRKPVADEPAEKP